MKDAKKRIFLSLLLALVLMLGGISLCLKPICAKLIRDNGIGRAVALRINDVLYEHFPQTISIDNATEIQNRMEKHPALAKNLRQISGCFRKRDIFRRISRYQRGIRRF